MQINNPDILKQNILLGSYQNKEEFSIANTPEFFEVLSNNLYSDPLMAVIRETITNAYDANIENQSNKDIEITVDNNTFIVKDYGRGIDPEKMKDIYCTYGSSTKNNTNLTGGFGLGCKAPFALVNNFIVENNYKHKKYLYNLSKDKGIPTISLMNTSDTTDIGLKVTIPIGLNISPKLEDIIALFLLMSGIRAKLNNNLIRDIKYNFPVNYVLLNNEHYYLYNVVITNYTGVFIKYGNNTYPLHTNIINKADGGGKIFLEHVRVILNRLDLINKVSDHSKAVCIINAEPNSIDITPNRESIRETTRTIKYITDIINQEQNEIFELTSVDCSNSYFTVYNNPFTVSYLNNQLKKSVLYLFQDRVKNTNISINTPYKNYEFMEDILKFNDDRENITTNTCISLLVQKNSNFSKSLELVKLCNKFVSEHYINNNNAKLIYDKIFNEYDYKSYLEYLRDNLINLKKYTKYNFRFSSESAKFSLNKFKLISNKEDEQKDLFRNLLRDNISPRWNYTQPGNYLSRLCKFLPLVLLVPPDVNRKESSLRNFWADDICEMPTKLTDYKYVQLSDMVYFPVKTKNQGDKLYKELRDKGYIVIYLHLNLPEEVVVSGSDNKVLPGYKKDILNDVTKFQEEGYKVIFNDTEDMELNKFNGLLRYGFYDIPNWCKYNDKDPKMTYTEVLYRKGLPKIIYAMSDLYKDEHMYSSKDRVNTNSFIYNGNAISFASNSWFDWYRSKNFQEDKVKVMHSFKKLENKYFRELNLKSYKDYVRAKLCEDVFKDEIVGSLYVMATALTRDNSSLYKDFRQTTFRDSFLNLIWCVVSSPKLAERYNLPILNIYQTNLLATALAYYNSTMHVFRPSEGYNIKQHPLAHKLLKKAAVITQNDMFTQKMMDVINQGIYEIIKKDDAKHESFYNKSVSSTSYDMIYAFLDFIFKGANK